jgi:8-oxo-dGTP pyrophosphatase MutT (NUDIX family)
MASVGRLELGETPQAGMLREVYEETGYQVDNLNYAGMLTWEGFEIPPGGLYIFTAEAPAGEPHGFAVRAAWNGNRAVGCSLRQQWFPTFMFSARSSFLAARRRCTISFMKMGRLPLSRSDLYLHLWLWDNLPENHEEHGCFIKQKTVRAGS